MRILCLVLALFLSPAVLTAQRQTPEWYRVYTFEDSVIDVNTFLVSFSSKTSGRVRFRWSFDAPQVWRAEPSVKYKSRLEVFEFDCVGQKRYRPSALTLFDAGGKIVHSEEMDWFSEEWRPVTYGSMMEKLYEPACRLLKLRRRAPLPAKS